ncbi:MAG TPA: RES family NAD+ phosphorylase [Solirubrobacterales bacterium]|nr:RES family NAD+ phosphorylase [Solirubrobacterales bacterium]
MTPRGLPAPPEELPELPSTKLGTEALWRIHAADVSPWFFDAGPDGRFNLADRGTCYLAEEPIGAFVEKFGRLLRPGGVIPEPLVDTQRLSRLRPPKVSVVDLTDPTVLGLADLTAEIHTTTDYGLTQNWAKALRDAGYAGIRYKARHDPRGQLVSIALFGSVKPPKAAPKTTTIPVDLIHEASTTFAITVLPRRHSRRR